METAKITSKSQITLPRKVREQLRVGQGDRIGIEATADGRFVVVKAAQVRRSDGAARRRLRGASGKVFPAVKEALTRAVMNDDQRVREGR